MKCQGYGSCSVCNTKIKVDSEKNRVYNETHEQKSEVKIMKHQITAEDVKKMEEEIEYRKLVVRKEAIEAVKEARAQGDLSENFEYYAAKQHKNKNESRIRYLERYIRTAEVISDASADDEVGLNKTVELYFVDDDEVETYTLVTTVLGNSLDNRISIESPLGKAILGKHCGDKAFVQIKPGVGYEVEIRSVKACTEDMELRKF